MTNKWLDIGIDCIPILCIAVAILVPTTQDVAQIMALTFLSLNLGKTRLEEKIMEDKTNG